MNYDAIIVGAGLSGLTSASLLSKRGLKVAVVEHSYMPGGSCGSFRRKHVTFDQGAAMLYGFGEAGFNMHRFVFDCLEEPIDVIRHDLLYVVNFMGHRIHFYRDIPQFIEELARVFPNERKSIERFYKDMLTMYQHVMVENPSYNTADETRVKNALKSLIKHPLSYLKFLGYLNKSAKSLLQKYFKDPTIYNFFDKLTSTYCYATTEEAPAVLAAVMFVDNHFGGSYYPVGSTLTLPGKLEKVIEEHGGDMYLEKTVTDILFENHHPIGVRLSNQEVLYGKNIIYSGTVWNLYDKLIAKNETKKRLRKWGQKQLPTYPSVVFYAVVDASVIPQNTAPLEMLVGNPEKLDESEVTAYILSIDDRTLCAEDEHTVIAIGPSFEQWNPQDKQNYQAQKRREEERLIKVLEKRFPGFKQAIRYQELASPHTIERYTLKNGGAVAGPKQQLGQHMFKRQHIRTKWPELYCCGESTVMGTGTPTVTVSGLSAANAILSKYNLPIYTFEKTRKSFVQIVEKPIIKEQLFIHFTDEKKQSMTAANRCRFCEHPTCAKVADFDVRGIMRRIVNGNFVGAKKCLDNQMPVTETLIQTYEKRCILNLQEQAPVEIGKIIRSLREM